MKALIFSIGCAFLCKASTAQFRYGVIAGGTASYNSVSSENTVYSYLDIIVVAPPSVAGMSGYGDRTYLTGTTHDRYSYHAGLVFDYKLSRGFSIRSKLLLDNLGWKEDFSERGGLSPFSYAWPTPRADSVAGRELFKLTYLSLPINFIFSAPLKYIQLYFGAGAYVGYGVIGHYKVNFSENTFPGLIRDSISEITFSSDSLHHSAAFHAYSPDLGLSLTGGLEFRSGLFIDFSFNDGLKNVLKDRYGYIDHLSGTGKYTIIYPNRNRAFKLGIGYFLK
jgi:hypothetical protein